MNPIKKRMLLAVISIIFSLTTSQIVSLADHSFWVDKPVICLDGATFTGTSTATSSTGIPMTGVVVFHFFTNSFQEIPGSTYTFSHVGQTEDFIVTYTHNDIEVGEEVIYAVTNTLGGPGSEGDYWFAFVSSCSIYVPAFADGRINDFDTGNPVVLYGFDDGGARGLSIYDVNGRGLMFSVPASAIAAVPECPSANTLIYEDAATGISFWRLAGSCQFQLNAPTGEPGKWYIIIFDTLYSHTHYKSWEEFIGQQ